MGKVREAMGGDAIEVLSGGVVIVRSGARIDLESGAVLNLASGAKIESTEAQGAALTTQLSTITIADAAGTPDYALQAVTNSSAYGFASAAEAISFLYVVKNLQTRCAEMEARMEAAGLVIAN